MPEGKKIGGIERAAILLLSLGEELAPEVIKHLGATDVQKISSQMAKIEELPQESLRQVSKVFKNEMESMVTFGGNEYVKNVLVKALGPERAEMVVERIGQGVEGSGLDALKWMDPKMVADLIKNEHPQTITVIMVHLDSEHASEVMSHLPPKIRADIVMRIATMESIAPGAMRDLEEAIKQQLSGLSIHNRVIGGVKTAAEILNQMDTSSESAIIQEIERTDGELATSIQDQMFIFADLVKIDDRGMQVLLKDVSSEQLVLALKVVDDALKEKFFKNMSERARDMLKEDMDAKGPVKISDVEKVQQEIIATVRRLESEGKLVIGGKGGEEILV